MSLDGVVQAPNRPEEDTDGGFAHGGWSHRFYDPEVMGPVFGEAMQGGTISVPTPDGRVQLKVPKGSQSGQRLRIKGKGVPAHGREPAGDLYLHLMVRVPKDEIAQDVIEKIDRAYTEDVRKDLRL